MFHKGTCWEDGTDCSVSSDCSVAGCDNSSDVRTKRRRRGSQSRWALHSECGFQESGRWESKELDEAAFWGQGKRGNKTYERVVGRRRGRDKGRWGENGENNLWLFLFLLQWYTFLPGSKHFVEGVNTDSRSVQVTNKHYWVVWLWKYTIKKEIK